MTPTNQQDEQEERGFGGCIDVISLVGMFLYAGYLAPPQWKWFVVLIIAVISLVGLSLKHSKKEKI